MAPWEHGQCPPGLENAHVLLLWAAKCFPYNKLPLSYVSLSGVVSLALKYILRRGTWAHCWTYLPERRLRIEGSRQSERLGDADYRERSRNIGSGFYTLLFIFISKPGLLFSPPCRVLWRMRNTLRYRSVPLTDCMTKNGSSSPALQVSQNHYEDGMTWEGLEKRKDLEGCILTSHGQQRGREKSYGKWPYYLEQCSQRGDSETLSISHVFPLCSALGRHYPCLDDGPHKSTWRKCYYCYYSHCTDLDIDSQWYEGQTTGSNHRCSLYSHLNCYRRDWLLLLEAEADGKSSWERMAGSVHPEPHQRKAFEINKHTNQWAESGRMKPPFKCIYIFWTTARPSGLSLT